LKLERLNSTLSLVFVDNQAVTFRDEWVSRLRALPYEQFGEFIRDTICPALSEADKKNWIRSTINNCELLAAIQAEI
jgi:hypothetical protein